MANDRSSQGFISRLVRGFREHVTGVASRPWLLVAGLCVVMVTLTILGPGYVASQPSFLERFVNTQTFVRTWRSSTHAEVTCQSCHVRPTVVSQLAHNTRMVAEFYLSIISVGRNPAIFGKPPNASCENCHEANRTVSPSGDLRIPHRAHVKVLKLRCIHCHGYVVHSTNPEGTHTPRMATCLVCHDGKQAKNACTACHKKKTFPVSHRSPKWLIVHPAQQKKINCKECHGWVSKWCRECHTRRPRSHTDKWRSAHKVKVAKRRNCEACHKPNFCVRCHGETPALNRRQAPKFVE